MKISMAALLACFTMVCSATMFGSAAQAADGHTRVLMQTSKGDITIELADDKAPKSVANFIAYVRSGFYDGVIFHRVIRNFMVQGGGFKAGMHRLDTRAPIPNEADNGLRNARGTIAMARTSDPDSASSQFFINLVDNDFLNFRSKDARGWGYAVFGRVIDGMEAVDAIAAVQTGRMGPYGDVPIEPVVITHASIIE